MDPEYARAYRELFENHWWWRAREAVILTVLRELLPPGRDRTILDVGCGDALFFDALGQFGEVEGVEADASILSVEGPARARIHVTNFDERFDPKKRYELILMLDVLEHLQNATAALRRARELLADEGRVVITVPAFMVLWTSHDDFNRHQLRFTRGSLEKLVGEAGLWVERSRYFFRWTVPAKLAIRLKEMVLPKAGRMASVPPAWLNRGLYSLSRREEKLLGRLPIPFGSSLLLVGGRPPSPAEVGTALVQEPELEGSAERNDRPAAR